MEFTNVNLLYCTAQARCYSRMVFKSRCHRGGMECSPCSKRSRSDALDADLFLVLILSVVAVGYLLSQIHQQGASTMISAEVATAIEAPFIVTEPFMDLSAPLFLIAAWTVSIKRAVGIMIVGLTCYATEWYIYMSRVSSNGLDRLFSRSFLADSATGMLITAITLGICIYGATMIIAMYYARWAGYRLGPAVEAPESSTTVMSPFRRTLRPKFQKQRRHQVAHLRCHCLPATYIRYELYGDEQ
jgi:hypothetical protein